MTRFCVPTPRYHYTTQPLLFIHMTVSALEHSRWLKSTGSDFRLFSDSRSEAYQLWELVDKHDVFVAQFPHLYKEGNKNNLMEILWACIALSIVLRTQQSLKCFLTYRKAGWFWRIKLSKFEFIVYYMCNFIYMR